MSRYQTIKQTFKSFDLIKQALGDLKIPFEADVQGENTLPVDAYSSTDRNLRAAIVVKRAFTGNRYEDLIFVLNEQGEYQIQVGIHTTDLEKTLIGQATQMYALHNYTQQGELRSYVPEAIHEVGGAIRLRLTHR